MLKPGLCLFKRCKGIRLIQMPQEAHDEAGGDAELGLAAPANAALVAAVKRVERGEVPARPENIAGINI